MTVLAQGEGGGNNFLVPDFTLVVEVVVFLVLLWLLRKYVWPPLSQAMEQRKAMVRKQAEDAEKATRKLEEAQEKYDSALSDARNEAARIRDDARADATRIRDEMKEQAEAEVARIKQRGEEQLATQRDEAARSLRSEVGTLSVELAEKLLRGSLGDQSRRRETVDSFLSDLDGMSRKDSGAAAPAAGQT